MVLDARALVVTFVLVASGAASADVLKVPQQFATIQEAMTAVQSGDTILIAAGTYTETGEMVGKQDVVIRAKGKVTIEDPTPLAGTEVLRIGGSQRCSVIGMRLKAKSGSIGLAFSTSSDCRAERCRIDGGAFGISIGTCSRMTIDRCTISGATIGISFDANSGIIRRCRLKGNATALLVNNGASEVRDNRISASTGNGIEVAFGVESVVATGNVMRDSGGAAVLVKDLETGALFADNRVTGGVSGIVASGDHAPFTGNSITGCEQIGIAVQSDGIAVVGNRVKKCDVGIVVDDSVQFSLVLGNTIRASLQVGIRLDVGASGNVVRGNSAKQSGEFDLRDDSGQVNHVFDNQFGTVGP